MVAGFAHAHVRGDCISETTLISVKLCTLNVMCMVAIIAEAVGDIGMHICAGKWQLLSMVF